MVGIESALDFDGEAGNKAAIDMLSLRAFNTPLIWLTAVLSVSKTETFGESDVCRISEAPLRPLITPRSFVVWANKVDVSEVSAIANNSPVNGSLIGWF